MKIDLATLKRIAKATPELTIAQFVAVWSEKLEDEKRERDRERHRKSPEMNAENARKMDGKPQSREEQEKALYRLATEVCGKNSGGFVTALIKLNGFDVEIVRNVFETARKMADPREYVAGQCRRDSNGTRTSSVSSAADRLIAREKARAGDDAGPLLDLTPTSSRIG